jgi:hypothetical protein
MNNMSFRRMMNVSLLALVTFTMIGCTPKLDGKYENANGIMSVEFKSNKAYIGTFAGQVEAEYEVKDDKITVKYNGENLVLTRNADGSLDGPMGKMTKK